MAVQTEVQVVINAKDRATSVLKGVGSGLKTVAKSAIIATTAIAGLSVAVGVKAVKDFAAFEKQMSDISTLISGDSTKAIEEMSDGILELTKRMPTDPDELGASAYSIVSAGISDTGEALKVLEASSKLAVAGLGTAEEATDLMTSAINTFASEGLEATEISDILFKTVKNGKTTVSQLARSFGASAPVIAEAGVTLADFSAATAALTTTGLPASQAQMGLRQAIVALTKPTGDMEKLFDELGTTGRELIATEANLADVFSLLKKTADDQNVSWEKSVGSVEALTAATGLMDTVVDSYQGTLEDMIDGTNAVDEAFEKQQKTLLAQWQIMKNKVHVVFVQFGKFLVTQLTPKVMLAKQAIKQWMEDNQPRIEQLKFQIRDLWQNAIMPLVGFIVANIPTWLRWATTIASVVIPVIKDFTNGILVAVDAVKDLINWLGNMADKASRAFEKIKSIGSIDLPFFGERQFGGLVNSGQPFIVGERGPELFVPHTSGKIEPSVRGGGGGSTINFNVSIGMYAGSETEKRNVASELYSAIVRLARSQNKTVAELLGG